MSELKKKVDVKLIWFVYKPEKNIVKQSFKDIDIIYLQDYDDALDVLKKEKPDLIFSFPWHDFIAYSFSLPAKSMNIPTFSILFTHQYQKRSQRQIIKGYIERFFEESVPTDTSKDKKQFMRRGRFFFKKYNFLKQTQKSIGFSSIKIFQEFLMLLKLLLTETKGTIDVRFANDIHFAVGENIIQPYVEKDLKNLQLF